MFDIPNIVVTILIGAVAGWLAGVIMNSKGGLLRNIILGILGSFVGYFVLGFFGITGSGILATILISAAGACILIIIGRLLFK